MHRDCIGATAVDLGLLGIESQKAAMTYYIDPADKKRIGIVTEQTKVILSRKHLEAIVAEVPEIVELYLEGTV